MTTNVDRTEKLARNSNKFFLFLVLQTADITSKNTRNKNSYRFNKKYREEKKRVLPLAVR